MSYIVTEEEREFLKSYSIEDFERPSVATDIVALSMLDEGERESIRKLQTQVLKVLLVKRNTYPFKGWWALPGGFCVPGEDVYETARRELKEETGVENAYLEPINVYGERGRDPRGWIISNTFLALLDGAEYRIHAGSDAWEAKWFSLQINASDTEEKEGITKKYQIVLSSDENILTATLTEERNVCNGRGRVGIKIEDVDGIAFDHAKIILDAIMNLRREAENDVTLLFDLLPEYFTISQAQNVYECLLDKTLIGPNFRRKINDLVVETDQILDGEGFRPAKLYKKK